ncbi:hypothetical protein GALMADRAFT_1207323 [Galerina marginata CBS 339.88]|uniref:Uncharacterized protein n=1 Tax=Galerina marginata (strain CBS 339.88) TaxID=685588 RepID=A0A067S8F8_GALM3|nr:hypothetical protein GALMADRAFT_1207323 [Galerina marginata CBS 339.88]
MVHLCPWGSSLSPSLTQIYDPLVEHIEQNVSRAYTRTRCGPSPGVSPDYLGTSSSRSIWCGSWRSCSSGWARQSCTGRGELSVCGVCEEGGPECDFDGERGGLGVSL